MSSLKRTARVASLIGKKKLTLSDNLPAVLAFEKGHSSRTGLNRLCRSPAAFQAGLGFRWRLRRIEAKRNAADTPSRWFEPRHRSTAGPSIKQPCKQARAHLQSFACTPMRLNLFDFLCKKDARNASPSSGGAGGCGLRKADLSDNRQTSPSTSPTSLKASPSYAGSRSLTKAPGLYRCGAFWEIFSGSGNLSRAVSSLGLRVLPPLDIKNGAEYDLTRRSTQTLIKKIILEYGVSYIHIGTPCTVFSRARHNIRNHTKARARERIGCELAFFSAELARFCHAHGVSWTIENPESSRLWEFEAIVELSLLPGVHKVRFPYCDYGVGYKKPTVLLSNSDLVDGLEQVCPHKSHPTVLRGRVRVSAQGGSQWANMTEVAGAYPPKLCQLWAQSIKPTLLDAAEEPGPDPGLIQHAFAKAHSGCGEEKFPILQRLSARCPNLLDSIVFGQRSQAAAAARRRKRREGSKHTFCKAKAGALKYNR